MRIRTIKPQFCTDKKIHELSHTARLAFILLWMYADDEGRFQADHRLVKSAIFPIDENIDSVSIHGVLSELSVRNFVHFYKNESGEEFGEICNFKRHQRINRPSKSFLPQFSEDSVRTHGVLTVGNGNGNGNGNGLTTVFFQKAEKTPNNPLFENGTSESPKPKKPKKQKQPDSEPKFNAVGAWMEIFKKRRHVFPCLLPKEKGMLMCFCEMTDFETFREMIEQYFIDPPQDAAKLNFPVWHFYERRNHYKSRAEMSLYEKKKEQERVELQRKKDAENPRVKSDDEPLAINPVTAMLARITSGKSASGNIPA